MSRAFPGVFGLDIAETLFGGVGDRGALDVAHDTAVELGTPEGGVADEGDFILAAAGAEAEFGALAGDAGGIEGGRRGVEDVSGEVEGEVSEVVVGDFTVFTIRSDSPRPGVVIGPGFGGVEGGGVRILERIVGIVEVMWKLCV